MPTQTTEAAVRNVPELSLCKPGRTATSQADIREGAAPVVDLDPIRCARKIHYKTPDVWL